MARQRGELVVLQAGLREHQLCFVVQKMPEKETTSSSDKLHQTQGEEMNEELLNGSFQLLVLQLMPGYVFFLSDVQNCRVWRGHSVR